MLVVLFTSVTADVLRKSLLWPEAHTGSEWVQALLPKKLDGAPRCGEWW